MHFGRNKGSPVEVLERMIGSLTEGIRRGEQSAAEVVKKFFQDLTEGELAASADTCAEAVVLRRCGLKSRGMAHDLLTARLSPGDDYGDFWYEPTTDIYLNHWCRQYDEARAVLAARGGYLLPYRRQFVVVSPGYIKAIGLEPEDAAWTAADFDAAAPRDTEAYQLLVLSRLSAVRKNMYAKV